MCNCKQDFSKILNKMKFVCVNCTLHNSCVSCLLDYLKSYYNHKQKTNHILVFDLPRK